MQEYKTEILAGITVAMALIPEALAFSIIAGMPPSAGLYAAFVVGLVTSVFGGRPGMISGATGAVAVGLASLTRTYGTEYLFPTVILAGLIQILAGLLKLDKFIRFVSYPVMLGFVNGLAILILFTQAGQFQVNVNGHPAWLEGKPLYTMVGLVSLAVAVMVVLPRITRAVPPGLAAIIVVFVVAAATRIPHKTVGDIAAIGGGFPPFHIAGVPFSLNTLKITFPYAAVMAAVALVESLLTIHLIDQVTGTKGNSSRDCIAQGSANILSGFFSGMGGCAMIGQSLVNLSAGGRGRLSGIVASAMILVFILFGASFIERIPMAALTGLMIMVAAGAFKKETFALIRKRPATDLVICLLVTSITALLHNLALAVVTGVVLSALVFAWNQARRLCAGKHTNDSGVVQYTIRGALFFASVAAFYELFDVLNDPEEIVIDFSGSEVTDISGREAINEIVRRYGQAGKKVHLMHLPPKTDV
jgi:SulP family sulfate permease